MVILARLFKQRDYEDSNHWKHGWENTKIFHEVVFTTIESVVILAAIDLALRKESNWVFVVVQTLGFLALMMYLHEPHRVCRRPFSLSYAAMAGSSSMA